MSWERTEGLGQLKETSRMIWRAMTHGGGWKAGDGEVRPSEGRGDGAKGGKTAKRHSPEGR